MPKEKHEQYEFISPQVAHQPFGHPLGPGMFFFHHIFLSLTDSWVLSFDDVVIQPQTHAATTLTQRNDHRGHCQQQQQQCGSGISQPLAALHHIDNDNKYDNVALLLHHQNTLAVPMRTMPTPDANARCQ
jgi:hypothetical protein